MISGSSIATPMASDVNSSFGKIQYFDRTAANKNVTNPKEKRYLLFMGEYPLRL